MGSKLPSLSGKKEECDDRGETDQAAKSDVATPFAIGPRTEGRQALADESADRDRGSESTGKRREF
jgi:hypothetical protein